MTAPADDPRLAPAIVAVCTADGTLCEYPSCGCAGLSRRAMGLALAAADRAAWRPIETAPKDRPILLLGADGAWASGRWIRPNGFNPIVSAVSEAEGGYWCHTGSAFPIRNPSHWQPLPPFPEIPADPASVPAKEPASSA